MSASPLGLPALKYSNNYRANLPADTSFRKSYLQNDLNKDGLLNLIAKINTNGQLQIE